MNQSVLKVFLWCSKNSTILSFALLKLKKICWNSKKATESSPSAPKKRHTKNTIQISNLYHPSQSLPKIPPPKKTISWNLGVLDDLKISSTFLFNSATRAWRLRLPAEAEADAEPRAAVGEVGLTPDGMGPNWRSLGHEKGIPGYLPWHAFFSQKRWGFHSCLWRWYLFWIDFFKTWTTFYWNSGSANTKTLLNALRILWIDKFPYK